MLNAAIFGFCLWCILLSFAWLLFETNFLRVHLPCGASNKGLETPKVLTVRELLDSMGIVPSLSMPKSWDTFTPCAMPEVETTGEIIMIGGKE